jgi:hypothetical protein
MKRLLAIGASAILMACTVSGVWASNAHFQGAAPTVGFSTSGNTTTATVSSFTMAGLGNTGATASLTVSQTYVANCENPAGKTAPGNDVVSTSAPVNHAGQSSGSNGIYFFSSFSGQVVAPSAAGPSKSFGCPNNNWSVVGFNATGPASATLTISSGIKVVFQQTYTA